MTYVTESVNALVALIQVTHNHFAAKNQVSENRALVTRTKDLSVAYETEKSWSTCRVFIGIDDAAKRQARLLNDYAAYVEDLGVTRVEPGVMRDALGRVFDKVCPGFALGCSRVLDSPEMPAALRNSISPEMALKIRKRVLFGPISDIAVAMNSEQAALLVSVGFQRAGEFLYVCRSCSPNAIVGMRLLGTMDEKGKTINMPYMEKYVENNILKQNRVATHVRGVSINVQFLREVFGRGRHPLAFVQVPLNELHKIPSIEVMTHVMADFEQLPRHKTTYKRFLWVKFNEAKEKFNQGSGEFKKLFDSVGYRMIGGGMVESHSLIKSFDGRCPDDADGAEICTEWPYYWAMGALFARQKQRERSSSSWAGEYVTPAAMRYRDQDSFTVLRLTRGWACRFNRKLLEIGHIVQSAPVCYGAAKTGQGRVHARWDLWAFSVDRKAFEGGAETDAFLNRFPMDEDGEDMLYRASDCTLVVPSGDEHALGTWEGQLDRLYDRVTLHMFHDPFLSAQVLDIYDRDTMGPLGTCSQELELAPLYVNDQIESMRGVHVYMSALEERGSDSSNAEDMSDAAGVDLDDIADMVHDTNRMFREKVASSLCSDACSFVGDPIHKALGVTSPSLVDQRFSAFDPSPVREHFLKQQGILYKWLDWAHNCDETAIDAFKSMSSRRHTLEHLQNEYGVGKLMVARDPLKFAVLSSSEAYCSTDPDSWSGRCNIPLDKTNAKLAKIIQTTFEKSCDFRVVFDVSPALECGTNGLGLGIRVDPSGNLEEYCTLEGPFVRRYRIELMMDVTDDIDFETGEWARSYMHSAGYRLAHFDSVSRMGSIDGAFVTRRSVRQRVWIQSDIRQVPLRDVGKAAAAVAFEVESAEMNDMICRNGPDHRDLKGGQGLDWCGLHCTIAGDDEECEAKSDTTNAQASELCPKCWWGVRDQKTKDIPAIEVRNFKVYSGRKNGLYNRVAVGPDGKHVYQRDGQVDGQEAYFYYNNDNNKWMLTGSEQFMRKGFGAALSVDKFEPSPVSVKRWEVYDGESEKWVFGNNGEIVVESRPPVPAHNREHWCAVARVGDARQDIFRKEADGAPVEEIAAAIVDFESAKHTHRNVQGVCWDGSPEKEGCLAFRVGHGVGHIVANPMQNKARIREVCCTTDPPSSCNTQTHTVVDVLGEKSCCMKGATPKRPCGSHAPAFVNLQGSFEDATSCAAQCRDSGAKCTHFAYSSVGTCRLYRTPRARMRGHVDPTDLILTPGVQGDSDEAFELYRMRAA